LEGSRRKREDVLAVAALLGMTLFFFREVVFGPNMLLLRDTFFDEYPWRVFAREAIRHGAFPLWNPYSQCGKPFLALPKAAVFYPLNVIFYLAPSALSGMKVFYPLHVFLAGLFAYLLGREWKLGGLGSVVMGTVWALNGFILTRLEFQSSLATLALYPLVFLLAHRMLMKPTLLRGAWLTAALSAQFLAGNTPDFYLGGLGLALYAVFFALFWREEGTGRKEMMLRPLYLVPPVIGSVVLCAVQLLPTYDFVRHSFKAGGEVAWERMASIHPLHYASLLVPGLFGQPGYESYWGRTIFEHSVGSIYVSVLGLMMVSASVLVFRRGSDGTEKRLAGFLWFLLIFSLLVSAGLYTPLYGVIRRVLPFYDRFRWPAKALLLSVFAMSVLAGLGAKRVAGFWEEKEKRRKAIFLGAWAGVWLLMAAGWIWGKIDGEGARAIFFGYFYRPLYPDVIVGKDQVISQVASAYGLAVVVFGVSLIALGGGLWKKGARALVVIVPVVMFADLFVNNGGLNPAAPQEIYEYVPERVRELERKEGVFRVRAEISNAQQVLYGKEDVDLFEWAAEFLVGEASLPHGVFKVHGGGTLKISEMEVLREFVNDPRVRTEVKGRLMDVMNVEYVIEPAAHPREVVLGEASRELRLKRRTSALPRAFVVPKAEVIREWDGVLKRLVDVSFDPREAVIIEEGPPRKEWVGDGERRLEWTVDDISYGTNTVGIDVSLGGYGFLVVSDAYFPGWVAEVDGERVRIYRGDGAFRAIPLEPGEHRVEMRYEAVWFKAGLGISGLSALALAVILVTLTAVKWKRGELV